MGALEPPQTVAHLGVVDFRAVGHCSWVRCQRIPNCLWYFLKGLFSLCIAYKSIFHSQSLFLVSSLHFLSLALKGCGTSAAKKEEPEWTVHCPVTSTWGSPREYPFPKTSTGQCLGPIRERMCQNVLYTCILAFMAWKCKAAPGRLENVSIYSAL